MNPTEAKARIADLTQQINYHNHLYYQEDRTEISDFEFDRLLEELVKLEKEFPEFLNLTAQAKGLAVPSPRNLKQQSMATACFLWEILIQNRALGF
jgi:NAD-dependent DNA ligase